MSHTETPPSAGSPLPGSPPPHVYPETPLFRQYRDLRKEAGEALLFFRLGDFYELFGDQAELASRLLGVTLTSRDKNRPDPLPMCGIPAKSLDLYLPKLIHAGYAVAIAEQTTSEADPSGLFPRKIVRTVTRFTLMEDPSREEGAPQNGVALLKRGEEWGAASLDLTSGRISVWGPESRSDLDGLRDWLERKEARELILESEATRVFFPGFPTVIFDQPCDPDFSSWLPSSYRIPDLSEVSCEALRLLFGFLAVHERTVLSHLRGIDLEGGSPTLLLDRWTLRHLDVLPREGAPGEGGKASSLVVLLDRCRTPMGSRMLRRWILSPDALSEPILEKHRVIRGFSSHPRLSDRLIPLLRGVGDLERILARLALGNRLPRDLAEFRRSYRSALEVMDIPEMVDLFPGFRKEFSVIREGAPLLDLLERALVEEPAMVLGEGPIIRDGFDDLLAGYRRLESEGDRVLSDLEERERKRTGIETLRIRYNQVAGYYIEVSRAQAQKMPDHYFRKQTLTNTERFTLSELIEFEGSLREARAKVLAREGEILETLRRTVLAERETIHVLADFVSRVDVLLAFFENGRIHRYVLPEFVSGGEPLEIKNGRHPVLECRMTPGAFMPNDTELTDGEFIVLTGPNMAGKSTYMRQIALIVLMAQAGSPVPADLARLPLADRVIARVGASDNILEGSSTFMVEMTEVARILSSATPRSLVLLDEVGRGTATFDGMAIAWAVSEFIHDRIRCRTLFATHYHELSELARTHRRVRNQTVRVSIREGALLFEHRICDGRAEQSYGIEVAKLAGLPGEVIDRASEVLSFWEAGQPQKLLRKNRTLPPEKDFSMPLFSWRNRIAREKTETQEPSQDPQRRNN
ncbi:MAG: DNA mismatch repair protein MutS [Nitrospirae bacterium]|nr:DNA mismatch repair protein MutS [Nitrospirota bacterium]MCL5285586.1 DNA mismatch repair protein MutS [Nitrospirota bacterium]